MIVCGFILIVEDLSNKTQPDSDARVSMSARWLE